MTTYFNPGSDYDYDYEDDEEWENDFCNLLNRLREKKSLSSSAPGPSPSNQVPIKAGPTPNSSISNSVDSEKERPPPPPQSEPTFGIFCKAGGVSGTKFENTSRKKNKKMSKKNGFFMFMMERRPKLQENGKQFPGGWKDVADILSEEWLRLDPREKERFNEKARAYNERIGKGGGSGTEEIKHVPGKSPETVKRERTLAELEKLRLRNREIVYKLFDDVSWKSKAIVVCYFSLYLGDEGESIFLPAEVGLTAFSLNDGIVANFGRVIVPERSQIPAPWSTEIFNKGKFLGLPAIGSGEAPEFTDLNALMEGISSFLFAYQSYYPPKAKGDLFVFSLDSDFERIHNAFNWLNQISGETRQVHVLSLNLWAHLASTANVNASVFRSHPGDMDIRDRFKVEFIEVDTLNSITSAKRQVGEPLNRCYIYNDEVPLIKYGLFVEEDHVDQTVKDIDNYRYYDELCCVYHNRKEECIQHCALNTANRYSYGVLEVVTISNEIDVIPTKHYPEVGQPQMEWDRRKEMLKRWGITEFEEKLLKLPSPSERPTSYSEAVMGRDKFRRNDENRSGWRAPGQGRPGRNTLDRGQRRERNERNRNQNRGNSREMPALNEEPTGDMYPALN